MLQEGIAAMRHDFARDYAGTVARMWDVMGVTNSLMLRQLNARVERHNVYGVGRQGAYNRHVAKNTSVRDLMRATLRDSGKGYRRIQRARRAIGFPEVGREGPPPGEEATTFTTNELLEPCRDLCAAVGN